MYFLIFIRGDNIYDLALLKIFKDIRDGFELKSKINTDIADENKNSRPN